MHYAPIGRLNFKNRAALLDYVLKSKHANDTYPKSGVVYLVSIDLFNLHYLYVL